MIQLCTCTGGSASTLEPIRKRAGTASCKTCGGKLFEGSLSDSMLSTAGLELTSIINPDLTWKKISKGNRSASRRARRPIARNLKESVVLIDKDPKKVDDMPVSESEKLGVTILGRRFSDKVEHIPIKKRRFRFRSPSPPPRPPSPLPEESERLLKSEHVSGQESSLNLIAEQKVMAMDAPTGIRLDQVVDSRIAVIRKNCEEMNSNLGDNEDFSGISILAAAACNNRIEGSTDNAEEGSALEESNVQERSFEVLVNTESCSVLKEPCKDTLTCTKISNEGSDSCVSAMPVEETTAPVGTANSSIKDVPCGVDMKDSSSLDDSLGVLQNLPSSKDEGTLRRFGPLRDDRSHWDLNTVMDAWESPCDEPIVGPQKKVIDGVSEDGTHSEKLGNLEAYGVQRELGDTKHDITNAVQPIIGKVALDDVHEDICGLADSKSLAVGTYKSDREGDKSDACTGPDRTTCFQQKDLSSQIDGAADSVMDWVEEPKMLHGQGRISCNAESVVSSLPHALEPPMSTNTCAVAAQHALQGGVNFGYTGNSESLSSHLVVSVDACINHSSCPEVHKIMETPVSEENRDTASTVAIVRQTGNDSAADAERGENICSSPQSEKHDIVLPYAAVSEAIHEIDNGPTEDGEDAGRISGLHDNGNALNKLRSTDIITCQPLRPGPSDSVINDAVRNLDIEDVFCSSSNSEELSSSGAFTGKGEPVVDVDTKVPDDKIFVADATEGDPPVHIESEELTCKPLGQTTGMVDTPSGFSSHEACRSYADDPVNSSGKVALELDNFDDVDYDSDFSQDDDDPRAMERDSELQASYDSQYEDGELRESVLHNWEEDAGEEGEAEHVDYGSDNRDTYSCDAVTDYPDSMSVEVDGREKCQDERSTVVDDIDFERDQVVEKNVREANGQPCLGGLSKRGILEAGCCDRRAVMVQRHSRGQFARKGDIEKFEIDAKVGSELSAGADKVTRHNELYGRGDAAKESTQSETLRMMKLSGWDQLPEGCRSSANMSMGVRDGSAEKDHTVVHTEGPNSGDSVTRVIGSTTSRRELLSRVEGPSSSDVLLRQNRLCIQGSRSNHLDDPNPRVDRNRGSGNFMGRGGSLLRMHGRGKQGDRWVDSSAVHWGPERHHSPSFAPPGSKNAAAVAKIESSGFIVAADGTLLKADGVGPDGRIRRQSANASSQGVQQSFTRRGSPSGRDEGRLGPVVEMGPDRSIGRGRSGRYGPRMVGTGPRERYHGPPADDSSLRIQRSLVTRERSYSPSQRRGATHLPRSHTKSRSRSRTRSPHAWSSPRGRNGGGIGSVPGLRHRSRSPPNSRSDARMERVRSPHRRPGFSADHIVGFVPTSRSRGSPQQTSRWIDNRKDAVDHFREHGYEQQHSVSERSPGRNFPRSHRPDLVGTTGRLKPDEYCRPMHLGRFPAMVGAGTGRGSRYKESDDDRRKHGDRFGFVHPGRRYNSDGPGKRFQYDMEDDFGFAARNPRNSHNKDAAEFHGRGGSPKNYERGIDSRLGDAPRRSREEMGHFRYGRNWKYNDNSMREC